MGLEICSQSRFFIERFSDCFKLWCGLILSVLAVDNVLTVSLAYKGE
jgi:hypothetical protein